MAWYRCGANSSSGGGNVMHCPQGKMAKESGGAAFQDFTTSGGISCANGLLIFNVGDLKGKTVKFQGNSNYETSLYAFRFYGTEDDPHIQASNIGSFSGWTQSWSAPNSWGDDDTVMFTTSRRGHSADFSLSWTIT